MTLQQLKYAVQVAACGSISEAARKLLIAQPTLTESVLALEKELKLKIFSRTKKGVTITREGEEFLASARQILDEAAAITEKYTGEVSRCPQFSVSCQHYAFAVEAFMRVVASSASSAYDLTIRETVTSEIIDDVARGRSEIGMLYLSKRNEKTLRKIFRREELVFTELYFAKPHVFLSKKHPLAKKKLIMPTELDLYPYVTYEQGLENALYFSEEVMDAIDRKKNIRVRDRATMTKLILGLQGYTVSSGANAKTYAPEMIAVPLNLEEKICVGFIKRNKVELSSADQIFLDEVKKLISANKNSN